MRDLLGSGGPPEPAPGAPSEVRAEGQPGASARPPGLRRRLTARPKPAQARSEAVVMTRVIKATATTVPGGIAGVRAAIRNTSRGPTPPGKTTSSSPHEKASA